MARKLAALVAVSLLVSLLALTAPSPIAEAQTAVTCNAGNQTQLSACINAFNVSPSDVATRIEFTADISLGGALPNIDPAGPNLPILNIDGNGYTLDGNGELVALTLVDNRSTRVDNLTIRGAILGVVISAGLVDMHSMTFDGNLIGVFDNSTQTRVFDSTFFPRRPSTGETSAGVFIGQNSGGFQAITSTFAGPGHAFLADSVKEVLPNDSLIATEGSGCAGGAFVDSSVKSVYSDDSCGPAAAPGLRNTIASSLADNGCSAPCTRTIALLPGSPAIDHRGGALGQCGDFDQRGVPRTAGFCDAGAYEAVDCDGSHEVGTFAELNLAIGCFNNAAPGTTTTVNLIGDVSAPFDPPVVNNAGRGLVVNGGGHTINAGFRLGSRLFRVSGGDLVVHDLTMQNFGTLVNTFGGSTVSMDGVTSANGAEVRAGSSGSMTIVNSSFDFAFFRVDGSGPVLVESSTLRYSNNGFSFLAGSGSIDFVGSLVSSDSGVNICSSTLTVNDLGGNAFSGDSCTGTATPGLDASVSSTLAANGCSAPCTPTFALLPGSPAIDAHDECGAGSVDQRGVARTAGKCDAGAFEYGDISPPSTERCNNLLVTIDMNTNGGNGTGTANDDVILGTAGADVINSGAGNDTICSGGGNDTVNAGVGTDWVLAGAGDDSIDGGDQADTINGGGGNDIITGGNGFDRITGSTGNDTITGGNGNDWVWAGPGVDDIDGGPGNDLLLGFDGDDTIVAGGGNDKMNGMNGDDDVDGGDGFDQIWGGLGDDHLKGQGGFDWIWGRWGQDTIEGGYGNDRLFGEGSADLIYGGPGNDFINGGIGTDDLRGNAGNDTIEGGDQNDIMVGGSGNDSFDGGFGTDSCNGNTGNNTATNCETLINIP